MTDAKLDIELGAEDELTPTLRKAAQETRSLETTTATSAKSMGLQWTELKSKVDLAVMAIGKVTDAVGKLSALAKEGAIDKNLIAAFERMSGPIENLAGLQDAVNFTQTQTDLLRFSNTLARFGADLSQIETIAKATKHAADDLGVGIGNIQSQVQSAVASGEISALRSAFGDVADVVALQIERYELLNGTMSRLEKQKMSMRLLTEELAMSNSALAGSTEAATDKYDKFTAAMGDLQSEIAALLDDIMSLSSGQNQLSNAVRVATALVTDLRDAIQWTDEAFQSATESAGWYAKTIGFVFDQTKHLLPQSVRLAMGLKGVVDSLGALGPEEGGFIGPLMDPSILKEQRQELETELLQSINHLRHKASGAQPVKIPVAFDMPDVTLEGTDLAVFGLIDMLNQQQVAIDHAMTLSTISIRNAFESAEWQAIESMRRINESMGALITSGLVATFTHAASSIGTILGQLATGVEMTGTDALAAVLDTLGTFALTIGPMLIATGLGIESLKALQGAGAVIAGAALVAIGAGMKAAAAGLRGNAADMTGGLGGGQGATMPAQSSFTPRDTEREEGGQTVIVINLNAAVATSEAARTIADIVNDNAGRRSARFNSRALQGA
jgi:hypothetical protein